MKPRTRFFPQTVYCCGSQCCLKCVRLGWGAVSASLGLSPNVSPISLCLSPWLGCCVRRTGLVSQFVSPIWLCLSPWLGCCLRLAGLVFNLSPIWLCLSAWLGCCVRLAGLVSGLPICLPPGFVFYVGWGAVSASLGLSPNLSPNLSPPGSLAGALCPPRWACLLIPQTVYGSASLGLSPVLSAILAGVLCPPRWAVSGLVSQLVSHLVWDALSASLVLSFSCLWPCLAAFVFVLSRSLSFIWDAVSARRGLVFFLSLALSPSLSPIWSGMLCPPPWSCLSLVSGLVSQLLSLFCLVACLSSGMLCLPALGLSFSCLWSCLPACLPSGLGCCVHLAGLVFLLSAVLSPALSGILAGALCPPCWAASGLVSQLVSHLVWDAVSASLVLSFSCLRSCLRSCLPPSWLGCCVRLSGLSPVLSPSLSPIWSGMLCPPPWSCLSLVSGLVSQLVPLFCLVACLSSGMLCLPPVGLSFSCLWSCLPACLGC